MSLSGCFRPEPGERSARNLSQWLSGLEIPQSATTERFTDFFQRLPDGSIAAQGFIDVAWLINDEDIPKLMTQARRKGYHEEYVSSADSLFLAGHFPNFEPSGHLYKLKTRRSVENYTYVVLDSIASNAVHQDRTGERVLMQSEMAYYISDSLCPKLRA